MWTSTISPASKIFAIFFPFLIIGISRANYVLKSQALFFVSTNILSKYIILWSWCNCSYSEVFLCLTIGCILLFLILYKYMKTRRLLVSYAKRGGWWASESETMGSMDAETAMESNPNSRKRQSTYDRALLTRFTVGFFILT
jgi:hypothetical protein